MSDPSRDTPTRREFFADVLRYLALGGLAAGGLFLLSRRGRSTNPAPDCSGDGYCPACPKLESCPISRNPADAPIRQRDSR